MPVNPVVFGGTLPPGKRDTALEACERLPSGPRERCIRRLSPQGPPRHVPGEQPPLAATPDIGDGVSGPGKQGLGGFDYQTPPYTGPSRPTYNIPDAPVFNFHEFDAPTADSIYADPSYQFRLNQSIGALEASAAAKGVLRSGGTLSDITERAGEFASQEYGNIYNRALQDYEADFKSAYASFAPRFSEWETLANAEVGAGNLAFQSALDRYFFGVNDLFKNKALLLNPDLWGYG